MIISLERVQYLLCDSFTCVYKKSFDDLKTFCQSILNKEFIKSLTIIGRLLPMRVILAMRGSSTLTTAMTIGTISSIAIMFGALEQESKNV